MKKLCATLIIDGCNLDRSRSAMRLHLRVSATKSRSRLRWLAGRPCFTASRENFMAVYSERAEQPCLRKI
jgi:hypothetical protein